MRPAASIAVFALLLLAPVPGWGQPAKLGAEFQVNTYTTGHQHDPAIGVFPLGDFVVVWRSRDQDGDEAGVFGQRFGCEDTNGNGACDASDIVITSPTPGDVLRCSLRGSEGNQPTFTWFPGVYDRFRVEVSWDAGFADGSLIDSGMSLLESTEWQPNRGQWSRACRRGSLGLFIRLYAEDVDVDPSNPGHAVYRDVVEIGTVVPATGRRRPLLELH